MKINEKNLCVFASTPPVDMEGFLNKRGEVNKAFQKRYFVLKGNLLFYFDKKGDKEPLGLIIVEGCTIELSAESDQYCFEIAFNGNRTYVLSADSQEGMELWMKVLTCAGYEYKRLMVAELQRQLEEIEGCRGKMLEDSTVTTNVPKPPPRRQNPFNRPAPPLPGTHDNNSNNLFINGHHCQTTNRDQRPSEIDGSPVAPPRNAKSDQLNHQQQYPSRSQPVNTKTAVLINSTIAGNVPHNSIVTFEQLHETIRPFIMKDVLDYRMQQLVKSRPLIEF